LARLAVCTLLWDSNKHSRSFSQAYNETWVERLYRGFSRNLTAPFDFICFTDRLRTFSESISQLRLSSDQPDYGHCIEPYTLGRPMILVGLDTIVTGNVDHLANYCLSAEKFALPLDPYNPSQCCNGVALVPEGHGHIGTNWRGQNDMVWVRRFDHAVIDQLFPGQVVSYKGHVKQNGLGDARVVYFHGDSKPHELDERWIDQHWR